MTTRWSRECGARTPFDGSSKPMPSTNETVPISGCNLSTFRRRSIDSAATMHGKEEVMASVSAKLCSQCARQEDM